MKKYLVDLANFSILGSDFFTVRLFESRTVKETLIHSPDFKFGL